jgi:uncharacterized protein YlzI (FlbEa/FlbD family)
MIILTKIDRSQILVNSDEIEIAEHSHDTTISFKSGKKIIVSESYSEIIRKVAEFKRTCQNDKTTEE